MDVDAEIDELLSDNDQDARSSPRPASISEQECKWNDCGEKFVEQKDLVKHLHDHIGVGRDTYVCYWSDCSRKGHKQATRHSLITHCRAHTGERPYTCPQPGESLGLGLDGSELMIPGCGRTFTRSDAMNKHLKSLHAPGAEERKRGRAQDTNGEGSKMGRKKNMSLYRPLPADGIREELLSDPDLFDVINRLEAREPIPGVTPEDEGALQRLREVINMTQYKRRDPAEADDVFDEGIATRVPLEPVEVAQAFYEGSTGKVPVLSRSRWQVRYIMAKAKLMLVEEENMMRRSELAQALELERQLEAGG